MSLVRVLILLLLASMVAVSLLGALLRGLAEPSAVNDRGEQLEMLGLAVTGAGGTALILALLWP